jgi:hypothetical protein|tara:strand:- start:178 stop:495 length:318 start_codon:yes stop_codon:yes gene_type:complete
MAGGGSFSSDQKTLLMDTIGSDTLARAGRARITSIQGKGIASSVLKLHDCATAGAAAGGNLVATYKYGTEGLEVYVPGSGILFKEGIVFNLAGASGSVTVTITGA